MDNLKKPKTCYGCRALHEHHAAPPSEYSYFYCCLGFSMEEIEEKKEWGISRIPTPMEPCPKPRTYREYVDAHKKTIR